MTYKAMSQRAPRTEDTFHISETRTVRQRNGVLSTITKAVRNDGLTKRDITIFANGARAERIAPHIRPGMTTRLAGKYSQRTVFVALDVVQPG